MFKIVNTWKKAATPQNQQRGFPAPGTGAQQSGRARKKPGDVTWTTRTSYRGRDTYLNPAYPVDAQRGSPAAEGALQAYLEGQLTSPIPNGRTTYRVTREFSRGSQAFVASTGIVLSSPNPGVTVTHKPRVVPNYPLGQYINNTIFWANQVIPTTIKLQGLQTQEAIDAMLASFQVYGMNKVI